MRPLEKPDKYSIFDMLQILSECRRIIRNRNKELNKITMDSDNKNLIEILSRCPYYTYKEEWIAELQNQLNSEIIEKLFKTYAIY